MAVSTSPGAAAADDPLNAVRTFCEADGNGVRLNPRTWPQIAPLVAWRLEPAWDRVRLIRGYEISTPRHIENRVEVAVSYTVTADVGARRIDEKERLEQRVYQLTIDEATQAWIIEGPAVPPYLFDSRFNAATIQRSLAPGSDSYQSASVLVWMVFRGAGLDFPYFDTEELARRPELETVTSGEPGDIVVYFNGDSPYQVGILEAPDTVVSATLNAGVRRAPVAAFPGEVRYRRYDGGAASRSTPPPPASPPATSAPSQTN